MADAPTLAPSIKAFSESPDLGLPVIVRSDRTLRVKIIDSCGMTCTFCHNEGTPVAADNPGRVAGTYATSGRTGRTSIYVATNGVRFLPAAVAPDGEFQAALVTLRDALDLDELHLTGGEPSLHPRLADLIRMGRNAGFRVCMTSNGERAGQVLAECVRAGLDRINFSVFGTTGSELAQVQHERYANNARAERKISALREAIRITLGSGIRASANIVVPDQTHAARVHRLLQEHAPTLSVRLLNSLDAGIASIRAIEAILGQLKAVPIARHVTAGASGQRTAYRLPGGRVVWFKQIRPVRLPQTCTGCRFNNGTDCQEGYYGVRLYRDRAGGYQVGVCIQRMDLCLPLAEFVRSELCREIIALRHAEYGQLSAA